MSQLYDLRGQVRLSVPLKQRTIKIVMYFFPSFFKNNTTFLIFTNMFRRYIRHRQCDAYESLQ